eukprot:Plantae.Rhodophyta-Hildenbrandia_rubra.ctg9647.p1 GENE.Plantae.Rhodophyta-Hildenbrandia_rubra.ctg9647~~Plantae.Rhodophyta-Hildenbrandia_rubra.ctg9647.p1  ORF type:complete len:1061 (-),score=187.27 Plantae.Rhodophyta-Hildenbrandia_rubra.ctg9647:1885-5067(-)
MHKISRIGQKIRESLRSVAPFSGGHGSTGREGGPSSTSSARRAEDGGFDWFTEGGEGRGQTRRKDEGGEVGRDSKSVRVKYHKVPSRIEPIVRANSNGGGEAEVVGGTVRKMGSTRTGNKGETEQNVRRKDTSGGGRKLRRRGNGENERKERRVKSDERSRSTSRGGRGSAEGPRSRGRSRSSDQGRRKGSNRSSSERPRSNAIIHAVPIPRQPRQETSSPPSQKKRKERRRRSVSTEPRSGNGRRRKSYEEKLVKSGRSSRGEPYSRPINSPKKRSRHPSVEITDETSDNQQPIPTVDAISTQPPQAGKGVPSTPEGGPREYQRREHESLEEISSVSTRDPNSEPNSSANMEALERRASTHSRMIIDDVHLETKLKNHGKKRRQRAKAQFEQLESKVPPMAAPTKDDLSTLVTDPSVPDTSHNPADYKNRSPRASSRDAESAPVHAPVSSEIPSGGVLPRDQTKSSTALVNSRPVGNVVGANSNRPSPGSSSSEVREKIRGAPAVDKLHHVSDPVPDVHSLQRQDILRTGGSAQTAVEKQDLQNGKRLPLPSEFADVDVQGEIERIERKSLRRDRGGFQPTPNTLYVSGSDDDKGAPAQQSEDVQHTVPPSLHAQTEEAVKDVEEGEVTSTSARSIREKRSFSSQPSSQSSLQRASREERMGNPHSERARGEVRDQEGVHRPGSFVRERLLIAALPDLKKGLERKYEQKLRQDSARRHRGIKRMVELLRENSGNMAVVRQCLTTLIHLSDEDTTAAKVMGSHGAVELVVQITDALQSTGARTADLELCLHLLYGLIKGVPENQVTAYSFQAVNVITSVCTDVGHRSSALIATDSLAAYVVLLVESQQAVGVSTPAASVRDMFDAIWRIMKAHQGNSHVQKVGLWCLRVFSSRALPGSIPLPFVRLAADAVTKAVPQVRNDYSALELALAVFCDIDIIGGSAIQFDGFIFHLVLDNILREEISKNSTGDANVILIERAISTAVNATWQSLGSKRNAVANGGVEAALEILKTFPHITKLAMKVCSYLRQLTGIPEGADRFYAAQGDLVCLACVRIGDESLS